MKQTSRFAIILTFFSHSLYADANQNHIIPKGVQWASGQSWKEIQTKAIKEKKIIFIDAFATWCGPCKKMDKETFPDSQTGTFFSEHFISVKVQIDKTDNDNEAIKSWYEDAADIKKKYGVRSFPTLLFVSPDGILVHKVTGFKNVPKLLEAANIALQPGQRYTDPNAEFYAFQDQYYSGVKSYAQMPALFKKALELREGEFAQALSIDYKGYLATLPKKDLYTQANIEFITAHPISSKSSFFRLFYPDGSKVDAIMQKKGYAENIVDKTILREIVEPMLDFKTSGVGLVSGKTDSSEADWKELHDAIAQNYNAAYAKRNVLTAQLSWYAKHRNDVKYDEALYQALELYGIDSLNKQSERSFRSINGKMWKIFTSSFDTVQLKYAAKWMEQVVRNSSKSPDNPVFIDTYANILYKLGKTKEAISWEEKAVEILKIKNSVLYTKEYEAVLSKMKMGIPTWKK